MDNPILPQEPAVVNHLTRQQRLVWQRLTQPAPDAVTPDGYIRTDWIARAWGDACPGSPSLVHLTISNMNKRLAPHGWRVRGRLYRGGYQVVRLESEGL